MGERSGRAWVRVVGVGLCLVGLGLNAAAGPITSAAPVVQALGNGYRVSYPGTAGLVGQVEGRQILNGLLQGSVRLMDTVPVRGAAAEALSLAAARTVAASEIPPLAVAVAIAGAVQVGSAVWDALQVAKARKNNGGFEIEVGGSFSSDTIYTWGESVYASAASACNARSASIYAQAQAGWNADGYSVTNKRIAEVREDASSWGCTLAYDAVKGADVQSRTVDTGGGKSNTAYCFDENGVGTIRPTGGLCPDGSWQPATAEQVRDRIAAKMPQVDAPGIVRQALDQNVPIPGEHPVSLSGPSSAPSQTSTSTTTGPNGTSTTTTTINNNYNYAGDTMTWNTTTTTTHPDGSQTTTTPPKPPDDRSECEKNPKAIGCMDAGDPPDGDVPKSSVTVSYTPESVDLPSGCPADIDLGDGHVLSYGRICDSMTAIRPFVIACALLLALGICLVALS